MIITKLETQRLILRKPRMSDVDDVVEGIADLTVSRTLTNVSHPYPKREAINWIKKQKEKLA